MWTSAPPSLSSPAPRLVRAVASRAEAKQGRRQAGRLAEEGARTDNVARVILLQAQADGRRPTARDEDASLCRTHSTGA